MELELCPVEPEGSNVVGRVQFTSERSGWSVREARGSIRPDGTLDLREHRFDVDEPNFGWMFCLIDEYELRREGERGASGTYESRACADRAKVRLMRVRP
jgi:hypothetical protein